MERRRGTRAAGRATFTEAGLNLRRAQPKCPTDLTRSVEASLIFQSLEQRFTNWWVASRFVVGRENLLKWDFFNYIKIKNHKKWESEKQNKSRKGSNS
jgi:hypothetical protein